MPTQIPSEFRQFSQPPRDTSPISQRQNDKRLPPAVLQTQPSRRNRGRSSLGTFVSRILPTRRTEKGHTLRNEYQDGGPISAADLVFGITEPPEPQASQGPVNNEDSRDVEDSIPEVARVRKLPGNEGVKQANEGGKSKDESPVRLPGLQTPPGHGEGKLSLHSMTSQHQRQPTPLPTISFQDDPPRLDFEKSTLDKDEEMEMSKTQQMYRAKKSRREQRRRLLESGDFLGIQGANPRTGYWDSSTATSSSDPSQLSHEIRKKLEQQAKDVEEQRKFYEEAQSKYSAGLERANTLKSKRKSEKMEKNRLQSKIKQRRRGKWSVGDNGWSSVAEPELSPISQSVAGTPAKGTAPADQLFPMPSGHNPAPYLDESIVEQQDYFGPRIMSSTPTHDPYNTYNTPPDLTGSPNRNNGIPRKTLPTGRQRNSSSETILRHKSVLESAPIKAATLSALPPPMVKSHPSSFQVPDINESLLNALPIPSSSSQQPDLFLGGLVRLTDPGGSLTRQAIVISY